MGPSTFVSRLKWLAIVTHAAVVPRSFVQVVEIKGYSGGMPLLGTGTASMRAAFAGKTKAAETSRLEEWKNVKKPGCLKRKYKADGRHSGVSVLVDLEAGHLEVRGFVDKTTILRAYKEML